MTPLPFKSAIQSVHPYQPGKPISEVQRELGLRKVVKLASNENALGSSPKAIRAVKRALSQSQFYPDGGCYYLTQKLAATLKVPGAQIVIGNGSNELIELLARGFLTPGDEVLSSEQTFLVYPILSQVTGAKYVTVPLKDWRYDLDALLGKITPRTRIIFIANPNNPTGTYVNAAEVRRFLEAVPPRVLVCFDEAYVDFAEARDFPDMLELVRRGRWPNVAILRTFSKAYGLAGFRVGYGIFSAEVASYLHKIRQPFNVNHFAQVAAEAALSDKAFLKKTQKMVRDGRRFFYRELSRLGLPWLPSEANFILVNVQTDGQALFEAMLQRGVIVRSMKAYGLPEWLRITIGLETENRLCLKALEACLGKGAKAPGRKKK